MMKTYNKFIAVFITIIIIALLCACGTSHHLRNDMIYKETGFTFAHLKNNGLIIGGISSQIIPLSPDEQIKYSSILSNVFLEKLEGGHNIHVINSVQLTEKIGREKYAEIMDFFGAEKTIKRETVQFLHDTLPEVRYILFAHIENENIIDRSLEEYVEKEPGKEELETEYKKTYLLTVEFQLFDLLQEKLLLNNMIYNEAKKTESRTTRTGCMESCMDNLFQNILFGEPAEIDREEVLAKISERFVKDLQKI